MINSSSSSHPPASLLSAMATPPSTLVSHPPRLAPASIYSRPQSPFTYMLRPVTWPLVVVTAALPGAAVKLQQTAAQWSVVSWRRLPGRLLVDLLKTVALTQNRWRLSALAAQSATLPPRCTRGILRMCFARGAYGGHQVHTFNSTSTICTWIKERISCSSCGLEAAASWPSCRAAAAAAYWSENTRWSCILFFLMDCWPPPPPLDLCWTGQLSCHLYLVWPYMTVHAVRPWNLR